MLIRAGQRFRLTSDILAIQPFENRMTAVTIPRGQSVMVVGFPCAHDDRMADALWGDRPVVLFGQDLCHRAVEIKVIAAGY
jgi:hypothetical protein